MNAIARQLRAQIPSSTDPDRLEQMAREAEGQTPPCEERRTVKNTRVLPVTNAPTVARSGAAFVVTKLFRSVEARLCTPLP